jgi:uncharacterized protein YjbI with pentapeptide repeats
MANDDHVALIEKGVNAWNAWRLENADELPDLSGVDLSEVDLTRANLSNLAQPAPRMPSDPPRSTGVARANRLWDSQRKSA